MDQQAVNESGNTAAGLLLASLPTEWINGSKNSYRQQVPDLVDVSHTGIGKADDMMFPPSPTTQMGLAPDRAAALFRAYDLMGRGWLSRTQMVAALSELSTMHGLGEKGLNQVIGQDPATSRDARYSLQDFLTMYERIGLFQAKAARGERIKALSAVSEPPAGAVTSLALKSVFNAYSRYAAGTSRLLLSHADKQAVMGELRMNAAQLLRLCQDLDLLGSGMPESAPGLISFSTVDVVFAKCKALDGTSRRLGYSQFLHALAALSDHSGRDLFAIVTAHALRLQPHLEAEQATVNEQAMQLTAPAPGSACKLGGKGQSTKSSSLPKLRSSAGDANHNVQGGLKVLSPKPQSSPANRSPAVQGIKAGAAPPPGRLVVLERVLLEEQLKSIADTAPVHEQHVVSSVKPLKSTAAGTTASPSVGASKHRAQAWPDKTRSPARTEGGAEDQHVSSSPRGGNSPLRPTTAGSPGRGLRLARVEMVDTAGITTELWKYAPPNPEAWDTPPPWMYSILQRLQYLEERETERSGMEGEVRADVILKTQKWEQTERLLVNRVSVMEARVLAFERRNADAEALLGGLKHQVESLQGLGDHVTSVQEGMVAHANEMAARMSEAATDMKAATDVAVQRVTEECTALKQSTEAELAAMNQRLSTEMATATEQVDKCIADVKAELQQSSAAVADIQQVKPQVTEMQALLVTLQQQVDDLAQRNAHEQLATEMNTRFEELKLQLAEATKDVVTQVQLWELRTELTKKQPEALQEQLEQQRLETDKQLQQAAEVSKQMTELKAELTQQLEQLQSDMKVPLDEHAKQITELNSIATDLKSEIETLQTSLGQMSDSFKTHSTDIENMKQWQAQVTDEMAQQAARLDNLQEQSATAAATPLYKSVSLNASTAHEKSVLSNTETTNATDAASGAALQALRTEWNTMHDKLKNELSSIQQRLDARPDLQTPTPNTTAKPERQSPSTTGDQKPESVETAGAVASASIKHLEAEIEKLKVEMATIVQKQQAITGTNHPAKSSSTSTLTMQGASADVAASATAVTTSVSEVSADDLQALQARLAALENTQQSSGAVPAPVEADIESRLLALETALVVDIRPMKQPDDGTAAARSQPADSAKTTSKQPTSKSRTPSRSSSNKEKDDQQQQPQQRNLRDVVSDLMQQVSSCQAAIELVTSSVAVGSPATDKGVTSKPAVSAAGSSAASFNKSQAVPTGDAGQYENRFTAVEQQLAQLSSQVRLMASLGSKHGSSASLVSHKSGKISTKNSTSNPTPAGQTPSTQLPADMSDLGWEVETATLRSELQTVQAALKLLEQSIEDNRSLLSAAAPEQQTTATVADGSASVTTATEQGPVTKMDDVEWKSKIAELEANIAALQEGLTKSSQQNVGVLASYDKLEAEIASVKMALEQQKQAGDSSPAVMSLQNSLAALQSQVQQQQQQAEATAAALKTEIASVQAQAKATQQQQASNTSNTAVESELTTLKSQMQPAIEAAQAMQSDLAQLKAQIQQLNDSQLSSGTHSSQLEARFAAMSTELSGKIAVVSGAAAEKLQALEAALSTLQSEVSGEGAAAASTSSRIALLETAGERTGAKFSDLETSLQSLALSLKQQQEQLEAAVKSVPSAAPPTQPEVSQTAVQAMADRIAHVESSINELRAVAARHATHDQLQAGDHSHPQASRDVANASLTGSFNRDSNKPSTASNGTVSKRDLEALQIKVQQLQMQMQDISNQGGKSQGQAGNAEGGAANKPGSANSSSIAAGAGGPVGAQLQQLQMGQMQTQQQIGLQQGAIAQLASKLTALESRLALGGGGGGGGGLAQEAMQQATSQQLSLLQGALVQLNGEVNSLKLAVPQLMSTIKGASGGSDASSLTAAVASGQYGPVLGALAEEVQRAGVRTHNLEQDMRLSMTSLCKASDLSQLELTLTSRTEKLEEALDDLRQSMSSQSMTRPTTGVVTQPQRVMVGMPNVGQPAPGGEAAHRYATWDALKHAEAMLNKAQQQSKEEATRLGNTIADLRAAMNQSEERLSQRLEVKEKVLMKMAKEVDDIKAILDNLPRQMVGQASAAAGVHGTAGLQGRGGVAKVSLDDKPAMRGSPAAAKPQAHRYSMFND